MDKAKNAAYQQAHRDRVKAKFQAVVDDLLDDVDIYTERKDDGKRHVVWDMSVETHDKLNLIAAAKGTDIDAMMRGFIKNHINHVKTLEGLKAKHERKAKLEELEKRFVAGTILRICPADESGKQEIKLILDADAQEAGTELAAMFKMDVDDFMQEQLTLNLAKHGKRI